MKDGNQYEKGDLSLETLKKVYKTSFDNTMSQKERNVIVGDRLKLIRTQKGITQKTLCKNINVIITTYAGYEQGKQATPTEIIVRIAKYFNISADYIIGLSNNPKGRFVEDNKTKIEERITELENKLQKFIDDNND